ncbi:MAG: hypothetical protein K8R23_09045 [Chthoniobacter sp.]|nr:hypothetical protein [Chthoniobacter sp.]
MKTIHITLALFVTAAAFSGCAAERYDALEKRQDHIDARHKERMDRRELRSERADARADARFQRW